MEDFASVLAHVSKMIWVPSIYQSNEFLDFFRVRENCRIRQCLENIVYTPTWGLFKPFSECRVRALEINTLLASLWNDSTDHGPNGDVGITKPIIPCSAIAADAILPEIRFWSDMVVGEEIQRYLILFAQHSVGPDDLQELHCFTNVDKLAFVEAQVFKLSHLGDQECKKSCAEEWNSVELDISNVLGKIEDRKA